MASIGERTTLPILKEMPFGLILDGGELGEVLLPRKECPPDANAGDKLEVFLYTDSEDRPVATTLTPKAMPGEFARLKCVEQTGVGAFLDWGLAKDLLVPFREQVQRMQAGRHYLVYVSVDPVTDRLVATSRLNRVLNKTPHDYRQGQPPYPLPEAEGRGYSHQGWKKQIPSSPLFQPPFPLPEGSRKGYCLQGSKSKFLAVKANS